MSCLGGMRKTRRATVSGTAGAARSSLPLAPENQSYIYTALLCANRGFPQVTPSQASRAGLGVNQRDEGWGLKRTRLRGSHLPAATCRCNHRPRLGCGWKPPAIELTVKLPENRRQEGNMSLPDPISFPLLLFSPFGVT